MGDSTTYDPQLPALIRQAGSLTILALRVGDPVLAFYTYQAQQRLILDPPTFGAELLRQAFEEFTWHTTHFAQWLNRCQLTN